MKVTDSLVEREWFVTPMRKGQGFKNRLMYGPYSSGKEAFSAKQRIEKRKPHQKLIVLVRPVENSG